MARDKIYLQEEYPAPLQQVWKEFKKSPAALVAFYIMLVLVLVAFIAPFISPYSPTENHLDDLLLAPSWSPDGDLSYLLGTDDLGRDMLSRLLNGATLTYGLSIIAVIAAAAIGIFLGALSALTHGVKASILTHILDVILSIPSLLMAIIIVAILGPGFENTLWAIIFVLIPQFIHVTRNAIVVEFKKDYVLASRLDGANNFQIITNSIFPNIIDKLVIQGTLAHSAAILDIAALGFLGLGAPIPMPEWGAMIASSLDLFFIAPWTVYLPGLTILVAVVCTNLVGEGIRHAVKKRTEL